MSASAVPGVGGWRWLVAGLLAAGLVAAGSAAGWWAWHAREEPPLPAVDLAGADPAVAEAVRAAADRVRAAPRSDGAWGGLGAVLYAHEHRPEAAACFAQAGRLRPSEPRWPALQAPALEMSDPDGAIALYRRAVELAGDGADDLEVRLAELCLQQGRLDDARQDFERVLHDRPSDPRAHLGLARVAAAQDDPAGSLTHLGFALDDPHTRKSARRLQAEVQERRGDRAAALKARAAAEESPEDLTWSDPVLDEVAALPVGKHARLQRIEDLQRQGRYDEARELATTLQEQYPDVYWLVEGRRRRAQGQLAQAEQALRQAATLDPAAFYARYELGEVLLRENKYRDAEECFREVVKREPSDGRAYQKLGLCRQKLGDRAGAIEAYRQAVQYAPFAAEARRELGELLLQEGHAEEAAAQLRQSVQLRPDDEKARELLRQAAP